MRNLTGPVVSAIVATLLSGGAIRAHEIGTTRVSAVFHEGRTYEIEIVTDATALAEKLAASSGRPAPADVSPASLSSVLAGADQQFRKRVKVVFGSSEVPPQITYSVAAGSA